ncbi:MAG: site-specific DNA-methyltransferase, partial [Chlorobium sp.]|nr:site-specific DNA-methyltransferase [Chlorobium sp.]
MAEIQPEKMKGTTLDIAAENRARLKQLFPTVFTATRNDQGELCESIDFEKLKAELGTFSDLFESRRERYGMEWPGKKEALHLIQTLSSATLKPCRQESVNFDTTENLFIEGDNLEVLKQLQTSYYGKVKMIYIDPPYNTGKEFIYPDNFSESLETYLEYAGHEGRWKDSQSANAQENPRYHTRWLNMIYPRLYLARNLMREDGVIFISIDDNEVSNLRKLCDEIFGEENFVADFIWERAFSPKNDARYVSSSHDFILMYAKSINDFKIGRLARTIDANARYSNPDNDPRGDWMSSDISVKTYNSESDYPITTPSGRLIETPAGRCWSLSKNAFFERLQDNRIWFGPDGNNTPRIKRFLSELRYDGMVPTSILFHKDVGHSQEGAQEVVKLFEGKGNFDGPKPKRLLTRLLTIANLNNDSIVLDFFAGSATTAHAVLDLNKQDNGNRKFILVQLPEPCAPESEAFKAGYKTIADIGKERIRRVINKLNTEEEGKLDLDNAGKQDRGFKVLKLNKSNFRQWQKLEPSASTEQILDQLLLHIDHIDAKATPEELLYEILLKAGFTLTGNIETKTITGKELFSVSDGALLLCLEESVTKELIDAVIELNPQQFLCLDSAFHGNDQLKANAVQTFNAHNMQKEKHNQI